MYRTSPGAHPFLPPPLPHLEKTPCSIVQPVNLTRTLQAESPWRASSVRTSQAQQARSRRAATAQPAA